MLDITKALNEVVNVLPRLEYSHFDVWNEHDQPKKSPAQLLADNNFSAKMVEHWKHIKLLARQNRVSEVHERDLNLFHMERTNWLDHQESLRARERGFFPIANDNTNKLPNQLQAVE